MFSILYLGFPGGSDGKEPACNVGDPSSIPGSGRSLEKGMATHSGLLAWRMGWWATVHGVTSDYLLSLSCPHSYKVTEPGFHLRPFLS